MPGPPLVPQDLSLLHTQQGGPHWAMSRRHPCAGQHHLPRRGDVPQRHQQVSAHDVTGRGEGRAGRRRACQQLAQALGGVCVAGVRFQGSGVYEDGATRLVQSTPLARRQAHRHETQQVPPGLLQQPSTLPVPHCLAQQGVRGPAEEQRGTQNTQSSVQAALFLLLFHPLQPARGGPGRVVGGPTVQRACQPSLEVPLGHIGTLNEEASTGRGWQVRQQGAVCLSHHRVRRHAGSLPFAHLHCRILHALLGPRRSCVRCEGWRCGAGRSPQHAIRAIPHLVRLRQLGAQTQPAAPRQPQQQRDSL